MTEVDRQTDKGCLRNIGRWISKVELSSYLEHSVCVCFVLGFFGFCFFKCALIRN